MASVNKVILIGNLTRDPELKYTPSGQAVAKFGIATNERYKDSGGNQVEKVEFTRVTVFGKQAENVASYLKKGSKAYVEGKLSTSTWENAEGQKRESTEVTALAVQFLDAKAIAASGPDNPDLAPF